MQKTFVFDDIGKVEVIKKQGLRSIRLSVHPVKGVCINIPWYVGFDEGIRFLNVKKSWVLKKLTQLEEHKAKKSLIIDNGYSFLKYALLIQYNETSRLSARLNGNLLKVVLPVQSDIRSEKVQKFLRKACEMVLKKEAAEYIPNRVTMLASKHLFSYSEIRIGSSRSRWGSCRNDNKLTFSCFLMLMSDEVIDFVILHELSHITYKNHGPKFHKLVNELTDGREVELSKKLKNTKHPLMYV